MRIEVNAATAQPTCLSGRLDKLARMLASVCEPSSVPSCPTKEAADAENEIGASFTLGNL